MNLTRFDQKVGYAQLDNLVDALGDKGLMSLIVTKLAEGTKPTEVCDDLDVPFLVLWEWLDADPKRRELYNAGQAMWADDFHAETLRIADSCTLEEVPLAKLRIDTRFKAAANYNRKRFGTPIASEVNTKQGITVVIQKYSDEAILIEGERV